jgi:hypothetical protein
MTPQIPHMLRYFTVNLSAVPPLPENRIARHSQMCGLFSFRHKRPEPCGLILKGVAAYKERVLKKSPRQFPDGVCCQRSQEGNRRCLAIGDDQQGKLEMSDCGAGLMGRQRGGCQEMHTPRATPAHGIADGV